jgi:YidC/Oxa1 family membrane protein insertase
MLKDIARVILYQPLYNTLIFLTYLIPGHSVGIAIILLTIIIRLILHKPSLKAIEMQKKIAALAPEMKKIRDQYKGDKSAEAKATLELYRTHKVNPVSSCIPLLVQLPIFLIFYHVVQTGISTSSYHYLYSFTPRPETLNIHFLGIDLTKPEPWILPILVGATQFFQSWQLMGKQPIGDPKDPSQAISRQMMYMMPLFLIFISRTLPAALSLYWVASTVFSIVQQTLVLRQPATLKTVSKQGVEVMVRKKGE